MKRVRYNGEHRVVVMSLSVEVAPGDVIDVPDDFVNAAFEEVPQKTAQKTTKEAL